MHPNWARSLRDQCQAVGVPFFFKQWGEYRLAGNSVGWIEGDSKDHPTRQRKIVRWENGAWVDGYHGLNLWNMARVGKKAAGRLLDGVEHDEMPGVKG